MRTAQLHLQRSTEALLGYLQGITCDDHLSDLEIANLQGWLESHHALRQHGPFSKDFPWNVQPGMWHSARSVRRRRIPGCDFAPPGASKSASQAGTPVYLSLDTHPAYGLIDRTTRQLHGVLHGIQSASTSPNAAEDSPTLSKIVGVREHSSLSVMNSSNAQTCKL